MKLFSTINATQLDHLRIPLYQATAFFLTLVLVYLVKLLEFSLRELRKVLYFG